MKTISFLMQTVNTISMDCWPEFDNDAKQHNMNRSQFAKHIYIKYKQKTRIKLEHILLTLCLALLLVILTAVI